MDDEVHIGDTIRITHPDSERKGEEFVVVECPSCYILHKWNKIPGVAWVEIPCVSKENHQVFWPPDHYEIIRRNVDASLSRQLDDNLRRIFG